MNAFKRYYELDVLRFGAIMGVLLVHYMFTIPFITRQGPEFSALTPVVGYGYLALPLFFMISGYTILSSAQSKNAQKFLITRLVRLYPAYWVSCLLFSVGYFFAKVLGGKTAVLVFIKQFLFNLTMLQEFFGYEHLNGVYWTLTYELIFYLLVSAIIAYGFINKTYSITVGWLLLTAVIGPAAKGSLFAMLFIPRFSPFLIAGMLFYLFSSGKIDYRKALPALLLAFMLAWRSDRAEREALEIFYKHAYHLKPVVSFIIIAMFFMFFYFVTVKNFRLPPSDIWQLMGNITYPLYLTHTLGAIMLRTLNGKMDKYLLLAITITAALLVAWLTHYLVERPLATALYQRAERWFKTRKPASALTEPITV